MSLDVTILDASENPLRSVEIGVDEHYSLMKNIEGANYPLLSRMADYYEDATFEPAEISMLQGELKALAAHFEDNPELLGILDRLFALAKEASEHRHMIQALAD